MSKREREEQRKRKKVIEKGEKRRCNGKESMEELVKGSRLNVMKPFIKITAYSTPSTPPAVWLLGSWI